MIRIIAISFLLALGFIVRAQEPAPAFASVSNYNFHYVFSAIDDATFYADRSAPISAAINQLLVEPKATLKYKDRLTFSSNLVGVVVASSDTYSRLKVRESYVGLSDGEFDFLAGRRIVRWGTGYAFTAAGVLDPPRIPTDPSDRLNVFEGRDMVKGDWVHGRHAFTMAWSSAELAPAVAHQFDTTAFRYNVLVRAFDTALIAGDDRRADPFGGLTFTRVLGQAWEIHGEAVWREQAAVLLGGKFTTHSGISFIGEFYTPPNIPYYRDMTVSPLVGRQHYAFLNLAKNRLRERPGWKQWDLGAYAVANLDDRSTTTVVDVNRWFDRHFSAYAHVQIPQGSKTSEYGASPYGTATSVGIRFQL
jgi:hypothetical protein